MLRLGASAVALGLAFQRLDYLSGNASDQQLGHATMQSYDSSRCNGEKGADATYFGHATSSENVNLIQPHIVDGY